jgi:uncharacterized protein (DUF1330 family)
VNVNQKLDTLLSHYGDGADGSAPTGAQWQRILERDPGLPLTLINFFKFRDVADYEGSDQSDVSGAEAFQRYADVSMPAMRAAGGEFLAVAPFAGIMLGKEQDWDMIAIGKYPNLAAFLALYENPEYIRAFKHRSAAVEEQAVIVIDQ